ncbi:MAG TPA: SHOCT domain-containing protein [Solirubrobacteraceae bacterium]
MSEAEAAAPERLPRGRRYGIRALLVLATVVAVLGIFAVWANRQVLNADNWSETSTQLLENDAVRTQVSAFLVDQLYANVDVASQVQAALPPRLKPLAAPAASGLRNLAQDVTDRALGRPRVQELWRNANRLTAQQFINIAEGNSRAITLQGNAVVLDLRAVLVDIAGRLGLPSSLTDRVPPNAGKIKILTSNQVSAVQDGAAALKGLALVLPALAFLMFAGAVYLAEGRRRRTLMWVGIDLVLAGVVALIARNVIGGYVVDALARTEAARPAAEAVWSIGTRILRDVGQAVIIFGLPVLFASWLAGHTRPAVALRRAAAPWLRERPDITYGVVGVVLLLIIWWGPIPATRKPIPVLIMIGLVILGVQALRRQTAEEFPEVTAAAVGAGVRARMVRARTAVGRGPAAGNGAPPADPRLERLERLSELHDRGALTDEEYAAEKATVLKA